MLQINRDFIANPHIRPFKDEVKIPFEPSIVSVKFYKGDKASLVRELKNTNQYSDSYCPHFIIDEDYILQVVSTDEALKMTEGGKTSPLGKQLVGNRRQTINKMAISILVCCRTTHLRGISLAPLIQLVRTLHRVFEMDTNALYLHNELSKCYRGLDVSKNDWDYILEQVKAPTNETN